jgi:hypothetical protein
VDGTFYGLTTFTQEKAQSVHVYIPIRIHGARQRSRHPDIDPDDAVRVDRHNFILSGSAVMVAVDSQP